MRKSRQSQTLISERATFKAVQLTLNASRSNWRQRQRPMEGVENDDEMSIRLSKSYVHELPWRFHFISQCKIHRRMIFPPTVYGRFNELTMGGSGTQHLEVILLIGEVGMLTARHALRCNIEHLIASLNKS